MPKITKADGPSHFGVDGPLVLFPETVPPETVPTEKVQDNEPPVGLETGDADDSIKIVKGPAKLPSRPTTKPIQSAIKPKTTGLNSTKED
jgi:hypothetical protein